MYPLPPAFTKAATIANGETTSGAVDLEHATVVGLRWPAAFTGSKITFTASSTPDGTYVAVVDTGGTTVEVAAAAAKVTGLIPDLASLRWVKIVSDAAEGAERAFTFICKA